MKKYIRSTKIFLKSTNIFQVVVQEVNDHEHVADPESSAAGLLGYHWSQAATDIIVSSLHRGDRPKLILRNLQAAGCFAAGEAVPTPHMLYNKISHLKRTMNIKYKRNYLL